MDEPNQQTQVSEDWRTDVSDTPSAILKILDGETKNVVFLSEGERRSHQDFGTSIVFKLEHEGEEMSFYVKENNFSLLKQIKELGKLTGTPAKISRVGSKKSDTRYTIEKLATIETPATSAESQTE